jgi:hypothetical protein
MHIIVTKEGEEIFDLVLPDNTKTVKFIDGLIPSYIEFFDECEDCRMLQRGLHTEVCVPRVDKA